MQAIAGDNLAPERRLRSALHKTGLRFRKNYRPVPDLRCRPDIVFTRRRLCVFVDGCFWHGCPKHYRPPKTNQNWWEQKLAVNRQRDRHQTEVLQAHGWHVFRVWEHELTESRVDRVVEDIQEIGTRS